MNNQQKFITRSRKLKVHRANSQTMSYHVRFSTDTVRNNSIFFLLPLFGFFFLFSSLLSFALCFCVCVLKQKVYILINIRLYGRVGDKTNFTQPISGNKTTFFWPKKKQNQHSSVFKVLRQLRIYLILSIVFTIEPTNFKKPYSQISKT